MSNKSRRIDLASAKSYLKEYNRINDKHVIRTVKQQTVNGIIKKDPNAEVFIKNDKNAFVFKSEHINNLILAGAKYITIILGAHHKEDSRNNIKAGSFTLMALGYEETSEQYPDNIKKLQIIHGNTQAYQYPPNKAITERNIDDFKIAIKNKTIPENELVMDELTGDLFLKTQEL